MSQEVYAPEPRWPGKRRKFLEEDAKKQQSTQLDVNVRRISTRDYFADISQEDPLWKRLREKFTMTASEFGPALGVSKNGSRNQCWAKKVHPETVAVNSYQQAMMDNGHLGEEKCYTILEKELVQKIHRRSWDVNLAADPLTEAKVISLKQTGLWIISDHYEWLGSDNTYAATPDGLVLENGHPVAVLEIKTPHKECVYSGLLLGKIEMELDHYIQVQAQMLAVAVDTCYYACYTPSLVLVLKVAANHAFQRWMMAELDDFANKYLLTKKKPPSFAKGAGRQRKEEVKAYMMQTSIQEYMRINSN